MKEMHLELNRRRYHAPEVTFIVLETEPGSCLCASVETEDFGFTDPDTEF